MAKGCSRGAWQPSGEQPSVLGSSACCTTLPPQSGSHLPRLAVGVGGTRRMHRLGGLMKALPQPGIHQL